MQLAQASGIETPTREDLAKVDKDRPKKGSNEEWQHPHDEDARITKMKDGRTHLAHKLEHAVDMDTGAILGMTVQPISGDTHSLPQTLTEADERLQRVGLAVREVVCDKGYHANATMKQRDEGWSTQLCERTAAAASALGQGPGSSATDLRQSAPDQRRAWQAAAAPSWGTTGAIVRAPVGDRRHAPGSSSRA